MSRFSLKSVFLFFAVIAMMMGCVVFGSYLEKWNTKSLPGHRISLHYYIGDLLQGADRTPSELNGLVSDLQNASPKSKLEREGTWVVVTGNTHEHYLFASRLEQYRQIAYELSSDRNQ